MELVSGRFESLQSGAKGLKEGRGRAWRKEGRGVRVTGNMSVHINGTVMGHTELLHSICMEGYTWIFPGLSTGL